MNHIIYTSFSANLFRCRLFPKRISALTTEIDSRQNCEAYPYSGVANKAWSPRGSAERIQDPLKHSIPPYSF